jgi:hypothetical protein
MGVTPGVGVNVAASGLFVSDGIGIGVDNGGMVVAVRGWGVNMTEGKIWRNGRNKHQQDTAGMRMNIIIKKRRMDIL